MIYRKALRQLSTEKKSKFEKKVFVVALDIAILFPHCIIFCFVNRQIQFKKCQNQKKVIKKY